MTARKQTGLTSPKETFPNSDRTTETGDNIRNCMSLIASGVVLNKYYCSHIIK